MKPKQMTVQQLRDALVPKGDKKKMAVLVELVARVINQDRSHPMFQEFFIEEDRAEAKEFLEKGGGK